MMPYADMPCFAAFAIIAAFIICCHAIDIIRY
jgi:hypothetical protein